MNETLLIVVFVLAFDFVIPLISLSVSTSKWDLVEFRRKVINVLMGICGVLFVFSFSNWYMAMISVIVTAVLANAVFMSPLLNKFYNSSMDRKDGSGTQRQANFISIAFFVLIIICWALAGNVSKYHIAIGIAAWSLGDTAAAFVGKKYGNHRFSIKLFDTKKTFEGSSAMLLFAWLGIIIVSALFMPWSPSIIYKSFLLALLASFVEAISKHGSDTLTVSVSVGLASLLLTL